jgi:dolichyl-phosphate beta-glucosyltransferase
LVIDLSLVIPAFNEADRLPPYLRAIRDYLPGAALNGFEVIVVDDGSTDDTAGVVARSFADWPDLRVLRRSPNRGKGAAVRYGVLAAGGEFILVTDADGATPIEEESKLRVAIGRGADLAVGSRMLKSPGVDRNRRWHRELSGRAFAWIAGTLLSLTVRDPQCGFKMLRRNVAVRLARRCRERGYLLDAELLALAQSLGYRISEVAVSWREVPGSKLRLARDAWAMLRGLRRIRNSIRSAGPSDGAMGEPCDDPCAIDVTTGDAEGLGGGGACARLSASPRPAKAEPPH